MKGYKKDGTFHPIENKKGVRKKRDQSLKLEGVKLPKIDIRLPQRKETFAELKSNIERNANLRKELIEKNEQLADKILANPTSEFNETWREQIRQGNKVVKDVDGDIKRDLGKLTDNERKQLPDEIKNLRRFL